MITWKVCVYLTDKEMIAQVEALEPHDFPVPSRDHPAQQFLVLPVINSLRAYVPAAQRYRTI